MFAKTISSKISRVALKAPKMVTISARSFSGHAAAAPSSDVVIPDLVNTLEWVISSPPPIHQFAEPPIIVEIEHLDNLIHHD